MLVALFVLFGGENIWSPIITQFDPFKTAMIIAIKKAGLTEEDFARYEETQN